MSSIGDLGREFERMKDDPMPARPPTELDRLEQRINAFLEWANGRPDAEIRDRFGQDFAGPALDDKTISTISRGNAADVRSTVADVVKGSAR